MRRLVPGTVRYRGDHHRYVYAAPSEPRYGRDCMLATEYYDGRKWIPYVPGLDNLTTRQERSHVRKISHRPAQRHVRGGRRS